MQLKPKTYVKYICVCVCVIKLTDWNLKQLLDFWLKGDEQDKRTIYESCCRPYCKMCDFLSVSTPKTFV